jgi:endonuclease YncB( thermonuclease family)
VNKNILLGLLLLPLSASAVEWTGTVIGISDGDTLKVLNEQKQQIKIRLAEIDAPESSQAFGQQSKQSLSDLCFQKSVVVHDQGQDKYKRTLARIECNGIDANAEQVRRGMAWAYRQYLKDHLISLLRFEADAKEKKIGLWNDSNPTPPWEFRHGKKSATIPTVSTVTKSADAQCGTKTKCGEMASCDEARFYLNSCGLTRLDRDHDGVPCESLCK